MAGNRVRVIFWNMDKCLLNRVNNGNLLQMSGAKLRVCVQAPETFKHWCACLARPWTTSVQPFGFKPCPCATDSQFYLSSPASVMSQLCWVVI